MAERPWPVEQEVPPCAIVNWGADLESDSASIGIQVELGTAAHHQNKAVAAWQFNSIAAVSDFQCQHHVFFWFIFTGAYSNNNVMLGRIYIALSPSHGSPHSDLSNPQQWPTHQASRLVCARTIFAFVDLA